MKEHYFVIKWDERYGWQTDNGQLSMWSEDKPVYDIDKYEWLRLSPQSKDYKLDVKLSKTLEEIVAHANKRKRKKSKSKKSKSKKGK